MRQTGTKKIGRLLRDQRGVAAVEFSFLLPIILLLLAGAFEVGRAVQIRRAVEMLATQAALVLADCPDQTGAACSSEAAQISQAATHLAPLMQAERFVMSSGEFRRNGSAITAVRLSGLALSDVEAIVLDRFRDGQHGVVVKARYRHEPLVFGAIATGFLGDMLTFETQAFALRSSS